MIVKISPTRRIAKALLLLLASATTAEEAPSHIGAIFSPLADAKSPGMAVLVRKDGRTLFEHCYGVRNLRTLVQIDGATDFRLASFTKQFTAMAIMLLVHDRKLRYDQALTEIFPEFPAYGRSITLRHLLTHTSGLPDYEDLMNDTWTVTHQIQDDEVLRLLEQQQKPKFEAGARWEYSNSGYVVLGLVVARVSGQSFADFLQRRIFQPLHMNHTLVYVKGLNSVPNRAYGHSRKDGVFLETDQSSTSATQGDGGIYSNLDDLANWDAALQNHALLSEPEMSMALIATEHKPYGFGWYVNPHRLHTRMWHTGETTGFRTVIERFPQDQLTIIVLSNRTDLDPEKLALQVADLLLT